MNIITSNIHILFILLIIKLSNCYASDKDHVINEVGKLSSCSFYTYSDDTGTFNVSEIIQWSKQYRENYVFIPIDRFLEYISHDTWSSESETLTSNLKHLVEKKEEQTRVQDADLSHPIIVNNFYRIIDGSHRLMKAVMQGEKMIKGIFIENSILEKFRIGENVCTRKKSAVPNLPISDIFFTLPRHHLPDEDAQRRDIIEDYFTEHLPNAYKLEDRWLIQLERPSDFYGCYSLDPTLKTGLSWWGPCARVCDIPVEHRVNDKGLLAIEDQWVPYSWSLYFQQLKSIPKELILLHIDDHQDMMSPRVGYRCDGRFVDYITRDSFSLLEPEKVKGAILSGAIGKGSILTPLIWSVDKIHVRHLSYRPYPYKAYHINTLETSDNVISKLNNRISVHNHPVGLPQLQDRSNYFVTNDIEEWIENLPESVPVLLHFDMDYFNNRFDGNSNWRTEMTRTHDPSFEAQQERIKQVISNIVKKGILSRVQNITVGFSASFFPGEFWEPAIHTLFKELDKYGVNLNDLGKKH